MPPADPDFGDRFVPKRKGFQEPSRLRSFDGAGFDEEVDQGEDLILPNELLGADQRSDKARLFGLRGEFHADVSPTSSDR